MTGYELLKKIKVSPLWSFYFKISCGFNPMLKFQFFSPFPCIDLVLNEFSEQESSVFREVPVVIMSSEDVLTQIDR